MADEAMLDFLCSLEVRSPDINIPRSFMVLFFFDNIKLLCASAIMCEISFPNFVQSEVALFFLSAERQ